MLHLKNKNLIQIALILVGILSVSFVLLINSGYSSDKYPPLVRYVNYVDLDKFKGDWYIISNIPYFAEKNKVASKASYVKLKDNNFKDIFISQNNSFQAPVKIISGSAKTLNNSNTLWQSTFYYLIKFNFEVLYVNNDYSLMLLAHKSRNYAWVMARTKTIQDSFMLNAMEMFKMNGYDLTKFRMVPQLPEQISLKDKELNEVFDFASSQNNQANKQ